MSTIDYAGIHQMVIHFLVNSAEWFDGETRLRNARYQLEGLLWQVRIVLNKEEIKSPEGVDWEGFVRALKLEAVPDILESLTNTTSAIHNATGNYNDFFNPDKALGVAFETLCFVKIANKFNNYLMGAADEDYEFPCGKKLEHFLKSLEQLSPELQMALHYDNKNIGVARARIEVLKLVNCLRTMKEAANGLGMIGGDEGSALEMIPAAHRPLIEAAIFEIDRLNGDQDPSLRLFIMCAKGVLAGEPSCFRLLHHCLSIEGDIPAVIDRIVRISGVEVHAEPNAEPKLIMAFRYAVSDLYSADAVIQLNAEFTLAVGLGLVTINNVISEEHGKVEVSVGPLVTAGGAERVRELAQNIVTNHRGRTLEFLT